MRKIALIFICILYFSSSLFGQIVPFGSPGWKYYHQLPAAAPCTEPPNYISSASFSWKSPQYNTIAVPGWVNNSDTLPMGYAVNTSNIYGGLTIKKVLTFSDPSAKPTTLYIRRTITLTSFPRASYSSFTLKIRADDGVRVYFNETEVANYNLPTGALGANISAGSAIGTDTISKVFQISNTFPQHPESPDKITITAEIHQSTVGLTPNCSTNSSDLFIDMQLSGTLGNITPSLTRGPYLQLPLPTGIQVRWKTNIAEIGKVCISSSNPISPSNHGECTIDTESVTNHKLYISNLLPNTTYYYSIQNSVDSIYKMGSDFYFSTSPQNVDTTKTTKIWVTGDIGQTKHSDQRRKVLAGFKKFKTEKNIGDINLWLLLGDVCNETGSLIEYDTAFFATHDTSALKIMRQTALLSCVGNHDYYSTQATKFLSSDSVLINRANQFVSSRYTNVFFGGLTNNVDRKIKKNSFFELFSFPKNNFGQKYSTSVNDSTKAYYSYNHNNIHFIGLDSYGFYNNRMLYAGIPDSSLTDTSENSQFIWLRNDLKKAKSNPDIKWTIMFWHHSPYTRGGGHFSDSLWNDEFILYGIRDKLIRFLDKGNFDIDLILNGHSHVYSRSRLMKGHYGLEDSFTPSVHNKPLLDPLFDSKANSNGKYNSDTSCAYLKSRTNAINEGIVYVLTGSSSQLQRSEGTTYNAIVGHKALNGASFTNHSNIYQTRGNIQMEKGGSVYIEVKDNRLDAKFVQEDGVVADSFVIFKDINKNDTLVKAISALDLPTESPQLQLLKTNWPNVKSFSVTGPDGYSQTFSNTPAMVPNPQIGPVYILKDQYNCISQKFRFTFSEKCWTDVTINNTINTPTLQVINATGKITAGNKILGSSNVKYNAGKSITLTPGMFFIQNPARFMTNIAAPNCQ
ncbi:MAG: metallophosphoesterase [Cytophagaceae bacterium]|nr:metallophosphoesterase [Cytophagaceae bacterium]